MKKRTAATILALFLSVAFSDYATARNQTPMYGVYVWPRHPVYDLLDRLETQGTIRYAALETRPLSRARIVELLRRAKSDQVSIRDREQINYYFNEFLPPRSTEVFSRDGSRLEYGIDQGAAALGPALTYRLNAFGDGTDIRRWEEMGVEGHGRIGSIVYVHGAVSSIAQKGDRLGPVPAYAPERAVGGWHAPDRTEAYYFDPSDGYISIAWPLGGIWFGKFPLSWGPGRRGQLFLSDNAPSMPQIMIALRPFEWLQYRFVHAQLESGITDSTTIRYPYPNHQFYRFYGKYIAAQRFDIWPRSWIRFALYQSVVYGASDLDIGYMFPFVDLRHIQHNKRDRDNVQIGSDITVWWPKYTAFTASVFIDEISTSVMFDSEKQRNWIGIQIGVRAIDLWGKIPGNTVRFEYTRVNPHVYEHRFPWSTFMNAGMGAAHGTPSQYPLGFWLGQNSDVIYSEVSQYLTESLTVTVWSEYTRKGEEPLPESGYGSDYRATPFLSVNVTKTWRSNASFRLRTWRSIHLFGGVGYERVTESADSSGEWLAELGMNWNRW